MTNEEFEEMKKHCLYGEEILNSPSFNLLVHNRSYPMGDQLTFSDSLLNTAAIIAKHHHERFDGSGYPVGLEGDAIPLEARIVAVADVYDAVGAVL